MLVIPTMVVWQSGKSRSYIMGQWPLHPVVVDDRAGICG